MRALDVDLRKKEINICTLLEAALSALSLILCVRRPDEASANPPTLFPQVFLYTLFLLYQLVFLTSITCFTLHKKHLIGCIFPHTWCVCVVNYKVIRILTNVNMAAHLLFFKIVLPFYINMSSLP